MHKISLHRKLRSSENNHDMRLPQNQVHWDTIVLPCWSFSHQKKLVQSSFAVLKWNFRSANSFETDFNHGLIWLKIGKNELATMFVVNIRSFTNFELVYIEKIYRDTRNRVCNEVPFLQFPPISSCVPLHAFIDYSLHYDLQYSSLPYTLEHN